MKTIAVTLLASSLLLCAEVRPAPEDPLSGLDFLLGEWHAEPPSQAGDVFHRDLDGTILVRVARSDVGDNASDMQSSMTIYSDPGIGLSAIYLDNLGHVIHYRLGQFVPGHSVQFDSEVGAPGPRFRLTYSASQKDQLTVQFATAPPGERTEYKLIAEGIEKRIRP